jgi:hypothetical protein
VGALEIYSPNEVGVISVMVDGEAHGQAPVRVDSLSPGVHEVRFSPPAPHHGADGGRSRRETRELLARANPSRRGESSRCRVPSPTNRARSPSGADRCTSTAICAAPHRSHWTCRAGRTACASSTKDIQAPIQVIDLPGGNQRFAVFELGLDREWPRLVMEPPRIARDRPSVVSVSLSGILPGEISGMWLHTQSPRERGASTT